MTDVLIIARQIQQLEIYLNNLVSALTRGELPVNLQPVTQIFDTAITSLPPILDLSEDRFIDTYNDIPQILAAYAIDVTLSEDSYRGISDNITFNRFYRGNYWIIASTELIDKAWLVPNPLKNLSFDRMPSLKASFNLDRTNKNSNFTTYFLVAPALVQILPIVEPLAWKLLSRGKITNSQVNMPNTNTTMIEDIYKQLGRSSYHQNRLAYDQDKLSENSSKTNDIIALQNEEIATLRLELELLKINKNLDSDTSSKKKEFVLINSQSVNLPKQKEFRHEKLEPTSAQQEIISDYYHTPKEFTAKYQVKIANITRDCTNANRGSEEKNVILEETNRGNYWIFDFDDCSYLVPVEDKYINQHSYTTTSTIFAGHNYTPDYQKIQLIKPAIVSIDPNTNPQTWRLQQQGELAFL